MKKKQGEQAHQPLQLPTLAAFPPWGSSEGACRVPLTGRKSKHNCDPKQVLGIYF